MSDPKAEYDTPWKKILELYFEDFMAYCWPDKHPEIDWDKGYKSLDKELSKIARDAPIGNRILDKLIEIYLKNGDSAYVLVHVEVQGQYDPDFEERMFIYRYRLRDLHNKPIASIAILVDGDMHWRPGVYREGFWGSSLEMRFPIIKILDYKERIAELEGSTNPFSAVILSQLASLEKSSSQDKLITKVGLIRWLYARKWKREDIMSLLTFMDWVFALPEALDLECKKVIEALEEELQVEYVTSFERMGIEKGMQQGMQQGMQVGEGNMLIHLLEGKFKTIPEHYLRTIREADDVTLLMWGRRVLESRSLDEVFND
jgi:hypothetical protein